MSRRQRRPNLEGSTYHGWDIIQFVGFSKNRSPRYRCICVCGKEKIVSSRGLKLTSSSCGCKNQGRWKKGTFAPSHQIDKFATLRGRYRRDAKSRGYDFLLTNEEFDYLIQGECFYCGSQKQSKQMYNFREEVFYTGIDRVDNSIGYTVENCVPCCKNCNSLKKAVSKEIIKRAYEFLFAKS